MFQLKKISEIVVITANLKEMVETFCNYGGWTHVFTKNLSRKKLNSWNLDEKISGKEALIQFMEVEFGRIRFIEFAGIEQKTMRPASKLWDTGGILDIDLRMNDIHKVYHDLTNRGWSAAAEPMLLPNDVFVLDECLMTNADGMMIALAQRYSPPLEIPKDKNFASHVYLSAMTVRNLAEGTDFFVNKLGFQLLNDCLKVKFPENSPNNFGIPHNSSEQYEIQLSMYSPDGTRDTMCECIEVKGLTGNDFSENIELTNRGILAYRIEVEGIEEYLEFVKSNGVSEKSALSNETWEGIGNIKTFTICSPEGAWVTFFEKK